MGAMRPNRDSILYTIMVLTGLELVRRRHNKIEDQGRKLNWEDEEIKRKQHSFLIKGSLCFAVLLFVVLLMVVILPLIRQIVNTIDEMDFLKARNTFFVICVLGYGLSVIIALNLFKIYISQVNQAREFFKRLGRSAWDGSKLIVGKASGAVIEKSKEGLKAVPKAGANAFKTGMGVIGTGGKKVWGGVKTGSGKAWTLTKNAGQGAADITGKGARKVGRIFKKKGDKS